MTLFQIRLFHHPKAFGKKKKKNRNSVGFFLGPNRIDSTIACFKSRWGVGSFRLIIFNADSKKIGDVMIYNHLLDTPTWIHYHPLNPNRSQRNLYFSV